MAHSLAPSVLHLSRTVAARTALKDNSSDYNSSAYAIGCYMSAGNHDLRMAEFINRNRELARLQELYKRYKATASGLAPDGEAGNLQGIYLLTDPFESDEIDGFDTTLPCISVRCRG